MNFRNIKQTARSLLSEAPEDPYRLSAIHAGAAVALSLIVTVINFLLTRQMDSTGGLAGIGTRSMLSTLQTMLSILSMVLLPFWDMGAVRAWMDLSRRHMPAPRTLLEGFRRWGAVLRLLLLRALLLTAVTFVCLQASGFLYMFSPFSTPALEAMAELESISDPVALEAAMETMLPLLIPVYAIFGVVLLVVMTVVGYRIRLADLLIMDTASTGREALLQSNRIMKGHMWQFLRLDLSYWWYYGLQILVVALGFGDTLLQALNVPMNQDVAYFLFYFISIAGQFLVTWRFAPQIFTANAVAYDHLSAQQPKQIETAQQ